MKKACILIRDKPHYRRDAFVQGAINAGYSVSRDIEPHKNNILVIWNRYGVNHNHALQYEKAGGSVYVVENGYLGNDFLGDVWYSVSANHHNTGNSVINRCFPDYFPVRPYKKDGEEIIVLPQRGIGEKGIAMARDWLPSTEKRLKALGVEYRVRNHPATRTDVISLKDDLANAKAVVTWGSGAALKAMMWGIPVYSDFKEWIGAAACLPINAINEEINYLPRVSVFDKVYSCIFTLNEIKQGVCYV